MASVVIRDATAFQQLLLNMQIPTKETSGSSFSPKRCPMQAAFKFLMFQGNEIRGVVEKNPEKPESIWL